LVSYSTLNVQKFVKVLNGKTKRENEKETVVERRKWGGGVYECNENRYVYYKYVLGGWGDKTFNAVKVSRQHPFVLLAAKVCRNQGRALGSEEGKVTGRRMFGACRRGHELRMWLGFFFCFEN